MESGQCILGAFTVDPAEELVRIWLEEKGYFTMANRRIKGGKEIDLLAIKPDGDKLWVEVHVPIKPLGRLRGPRHKAARYSKLPLSERIKGIVECKFDQEKSEFVKKKLKGEPRKMFVFGDTGGDDEKEVVEEFKKHGIEAISFKKILAELEETLKKRTYMDPTRRYFQLLSKYLT